MLDKKPNFFVIGVAKAGTTSLYHYLNEHPEIYFPPIKETNFFARHDLDFNNFRKDFKHNTNMDIGKYIADGMPRMVHAANVRKEEHYLALFTPAQNEKALGEICNSYIFCPKSIQAIYDFNPRAKIVVILRNPIERAFSGYLMNLREGKTLEKDFITEIERDEAAQPKGWGITFNYLEMGLYGQQIERLYQVFPKEQVKLLWFEDLKSNKSELMKELCVFLGVDPNFELGNEQKSNAASLPRFSYLNYLIAQTGFLRKWARRALPDFVKKMVLNVMYSDKGLPKMSWKEFDYLLNYYKSEIQILEQLTDRDLSNWKHFKS